MKRILMLCCAVLLLFQTVAFAKSGPVKQTIPEEEMYIGGIGLQATLGYVKSIYGEPAEKKGENDPYNLLNYNIIFNYSPSFTVYGITGRRQKNRQEENDVRVWGIVIKDNSLTTPSGLTVGMPYKAVVDLFGEVPAKRTAKGDTYYEYGIYYQGGDTTLNFHVDEVGNITMIGLHRFAQ